jgi:hypothetical protein
MKIYKNLLKKEFPNGLILLEQRKITPKESGEEKNKFSLKTLMVN